MERWYRVNFQCGGILLNWIIVGQGPIALAVGTGVFFYFFIFLFFLTFFLSSVIFLFFLLLFGRRPDIDCNTVSKDH